MLIKHTPVDVLPHHSGQHDDARNVRASRRADIVWPIAVTVLAAGALVPAATAHAAPAPVTPSQVAESSARTMLESLAVKGRAPKTGYERSQFGQAWSDDVSVADGHNGCDTRIIYSPRPGLARFALVTVPASRHAVQPTEGGTIGTSLRVMR